jgi:5-methyltetrahydrofolate--homocysteine methyltransferase
LVDQLKFYKPDLDEAEERWQAFYAGELIDRPPVVVTAPRDGVALPPPINYFEKVFGEVEDVIDHALEIAEATFWGGEAVPAFYPSLGPDEIAVFCGAELRWSPDSPDTNWSVPLIEDWAQALPIQLATENILFQHQQELYRRAAERFAGRVLMVAPDLHTNMDLLAALRGPQRLCLDLLDNPGWIDRAMLDARQVFRDLWAAINSAGQMPRYGYCLESYGLFSREGSATLQCDFSVMMSPAMFRRWVLPALEEEAEVVKHVVYHWDGPGALIHRRDLLTSRGLHTLSFVPGAGNGEPVDHVDLLRGFQEAGKAVHVWGTPEECKKMHRELRPDRVFYCTNTASQAEAERLLDWFIANT